MQAIVPPAINIVGIKHLALPAVVSSCCALTVSLDELIAVNITPIPAPIDRIVGRLFLSFLSFTCPPFRNEKQ
jgi:hypothetical protein